MTTTSKKAVNADGPEGNGESVEGKITKAVLTAFGVFLLGWLFGKWRVDVEQLQVGLLAVTGMYWCYYHMVFKRRRGVDLNEWWVDWTAGMFWVVAVMVAARLGFGEPFKIPSPSMEPGLMTGDYIFVNRSAYGVRVPMTGTRLVGSDSPQRGDTIIFRAPEEQGMVYVKRVAAVGGDTIEYKDKRVIVNGMLLKQDFEQEHFGKYGARASKEESGGRTYTILTEQDKSSSIREPSIFEGRSACEYTATGVKCKVPEGHYYVLGDNRDDSKDSRFWGFVRDQDLIGKAAARIYREGEGLGWKRIQ